MRFKKDDTMLKERKKKYKARVAIKTEQGIVYTGKPCAAVCILYRPKEKKKQRRKPKEESLGIA